MLVFPRFWIRLEWLKLFLVSNYMEVIVVRHGETVANRENQIQGQSLQGLTERGREEIKLVGDKLRSKNVSISCTYTSDQNRAIETMEILKKQLFCKSQTIVDNRLREWDFGKLDGQDMDRVLGKFESILSISSSSIKLEEIANYIYLVNKGQSVNSWKIIQQNITSFLDDLKKNDKDNEAVLIVSHGLTILTIISVINQSIGYFKKLPNGFLFTFTI